MAFARDQLRLLRDLTVPVGEGEGDHITLSAEVLANCFVRIAGELEAVIEGVEPAPALAASGKAKCPRCGRWTNPDALFDPCRAIDCAMWHTHVCVGAQFA